MVTIRREKEKDIAAIHRVNELAFGRPQEADLVDALRAHGAATLSLVAVAGVTVAGHVLFSPVSAAEGELPFRAVTLAPVAVLPDYQNQGIGSLLIRMGLYECRSLKYDAVFLVGHPPYYPRFGFVPAFPLGIDCEYEIPADSRDAWMVAELKPGALAGWRGKVCFRPEFAAAV